MSTMNDNFCPNCNSKLIPFRDDYYDDDDTTIHYHCEDVANCGYSTYYSFDFNQKYNQLKQKQEELKRERERERERQRAMRPKNDNTKILGNIKQQQQSNNNNTSSSLCPNCQKNTLVSFKDFDTDSIQYYCSDIVHCEYSTSYCPMYFDIVKQKLREAAAEKPIIIKEQKKKSDRYIIKLDNIIGYEGIKRKLRKVINHRGRKKIHILIVGAPGTSKTVFLKSLEDELIPQGRNYHYIDVATMTKRGLLDYIFDTDDIEILAIDEIDKVDKDHQSVFLNMLETGVLQTTIFKNIRRKEVKSMITIATGNYLEDIIEPVRTRFLPFYLKAYSKQQYHRYLYKYVS